MAGEKDGSPLYLRNKEGNTWEKNLRKNTFSYSFFFFLLKVVQRDQNQTNACAFFSVSTDGIKSISTL